jgi:RNA polymerase sigma factor (TIGR02999 family)
VDDLTLLLNRISSDQAPADELLPLVYQKLRQVAAEKMRREPSDHTLQATALVHEAWLRVGGENHGWQSRWQFFSAASEAMRRILIERARRKCAERHGGKLGRVDMADVEIVAPAVEDDVLAISEALERFEVEHPEKAQLVKLRYFVGLTLPEAAEIIGVSHTTAKRQWVFARSWLFKAVNPSKLQQD